MKNLKLSCFAIITTAALYMMSSCSSDSSKTENREVKVMDSVSDDLEKSGRELDAQAKKVEASLEKISKEDTVK